MDRYVLVCTIEGEASEFHDKITRDVCYKFNKKRTKLPAHITLKAPFERDKIDDMVEMMETFTGARSKTPIKINGFGKFRRDVVYMNVNVSREAKIVHDELIDEMENIPWVIFKPNEGKDRVFHCTIVSKRIQDKFEEIWNYVNEYKCDFDVYFDNLSLYKWQENTWVLYRKFKFRDV